MIQNKAQESIQPGLQGMAEQVVQAADTAAVLGSGSVAVFGTPALVALMEKAAAVAVQSALPTGTTSVGIHMAVQHQAPTPIGMRVHAVATLTQVDSRTLTFHIVARDDTEQIGEATHQRVLVNTDRFMRKADEKGRISGIE